MKALQASKFLIILLLTGNSFFSCSQQEAEPIAYENPITLQRADPWVYKTDSNYYFIGTVPEFDRIEIRKAKTINGISGAEPVVVWRKHKTGVMGHHIWAPELHRIDGKWYIYFTAGEAENIWNIRMWVLSNSSTDPTTGEWVEEGQIETQRDEFALDATTFELKGQRYLVWAEKTRPNINSGLVIAKMKTPTTIEGPEVVISEPEYEWEIHTYKVNEGAAVLKRNGKIFITFSASATDDTYAMGLLWADEDADPLNPKSWNKLPDPVFYTNEEAERYGPGHNSFTKAEDGKTDVLIYHARNYKKLIANPLSDPNRHARARTFTWTDDGFPDFRQEISD
jgi:GH43 family beta-xylosidase